MSTQLDIYFGLGQAFNNISSFGITVRHFTEVLKESFATVILIEIFETYNFSG